MEIRIATPVDAEAIKELDEIAKADRLRQLSIDRWIVEGQGWSR